MAEEGAGLPLVMPVTPYDDLHFGPGGQIIIEMMTNDEISPAITVDKIVAPTSTLAATSSNIDLDQHAMNVSRTVLAIAKRVPPDKQSKLVDFCFRLHLHTIPDPINGGALSTLEPGEVLWSKWPQLEHVSTDYEWTHALDEVDAGDTQSYENYTAWRAQLSELGFPFWEKEPYFTFMHLTWVLYHDYDHVRRRRKDVRLMYMWLIYAPNKVWLDVQLRRRIEYISQHDTDRFHWFFWPRWKEFLKVCQEFENNKDKDIEVASAQDVSDEDTQELIRRALENMEKVEAEHAIRSGKSHNTQRSTD